MASICSKFTNLWRNNGQYEPSQMGGVFRSVEMCRCQIILQTESAYNCVAALGELGFVMFRDLNPNVNAFQRKFVNEVRRCDEMERKLRYLRHEIDQEHVATSNSDEIPETPAARDVVDLEAMFEKLESELREVTTNQDMLKKNFIDLTELKHVLLKVQLFFQEHEERLAMHALHNETNNQQVGPHIELVEHAGSPDHKDKSDLSYIAGVIRRDKVPGFERMMWRISRGNAFIRFIDITEPLDDPKTGEPVYKSVFLTFVQGQQLKTRAMKVCEGYRATVYQCPESAQQRREIVQGVATRLEDLKTVLSQTHEHRRRLLAATARNISVWMAKVWKIKAVYHTLNLFNLDVTQKCLIAECWVPLDQLTQLQITLKSTTEMSGSNIVPIVHRMECDEAPPTHYRLNKFTKGFQNLVDAYGISTYREMNPGPYTIITFPFLFAVMFGDVGHGLIMFLFALFMVLKEKTLPKQFNNEIFTLFFGGRYIVLLMGLFSIYTGIIYNEIFAKSFNIFGSGWRVSNASIGLNEAFLDPTTSEHTGNIYPFGVDPIWNLAENKLIFLNSFKMKMSVILGVIQMFFGIIISIYNYTYRKSVKELLGVFLPQIIFLSSIFVYLCILIIFKWIYFGAGPRETTVGHYGGSNCAPSLLIGLINMFMFTSQKTGFSDPKTCSVSFFFAGQGPLQKALVVVAVICVPWMLLTKPLVMYYQRKKAMRMAATVYHGDHNSGYEELNDEGSHPTSPTVSAPPPVNQSQGGGGHGGHGGQDEPFSDVFIYQAIHTIEFCLGCISHTASYLRLWALSLAHAQLSEVLWNMVLRIGFSTDGFLGAIFIFVIFWPFFVLTVGIMVMMEGLSAFLHALRLHCHQMAGRPNRRHASPYASRRVYSVLSSSNRPSQQTRPDAPRLDYEIRDSLGFYNLQDLRRRRFDGDRTQPSAAHYYRDQNGYSTPTMSRLFMPMPQFDRGWRPIVSGYKSRSWSWTY